MKTAVNWLVEQLARKNNEFQALTFYYDHKEEIQQAKEMEKDRSKIDFKIGYNQGYLDAQCNHINDADNFANEQEYLNESDMEIRNTEDLKRVMEREVWKEDKTFKQKSKWTKL